MKPNVDDGGERTPALAAERTDEDPDPHSKSSDSATHASSPLISDEKSSGISTPADDGTFRFVLILAFTAGIGGFLFGYDTGVISGALLFIEDDFAAVKTSTELQESIVSVAILGACLGASLGGTLSDSHGRRFTLLFSDLIFALGSISMAAAPQPLFLLLGRALVGLAVGLASVTVPLYIAECAPDKWRGSLVSLNVLMITGGQFLAYLLNIGLSMVPGTWRWMLGLGTLPAITQAWLLLYLPESPSWLFKQGRTEEAETVLSCIHPSADCQRQLADLTSEGDSSAGSSTALLPRLQEMLTQPGLRRALLAGVGLQLFQQLVGINTVLYYGPTIVETALGLSHSAGDSKGHITALLVACLLSLVNAVGSAAGIALIDSPWGGRRPLLLASLAGVTAGLTLLGCAFQTMAAGEGGRMGFGLAMAGLFLYVAAFSPGMGSVPWAVNAEIYPLRYRGVAGGLAGTANWLANWLVAQSFLSVVELVGAGPTFWGFAAVAVLAWGFVFWAVPETKGVSLGDMETVWES